MADWAAFAGVAGVVTFLVLILARASASLVSGDAAFDAAPGSSPSRSSSASRSSSSLDSQSSYSSDSVRQSGSSSQSTESAWEETGFEPAVPRGTNGDRTSAATSEPAAAPDAGEDAARDASSATVGTGPDGSVDRPTGRDRRPHRTRQVRRSRDPPVTDLSPRALLANVTLTQAFFACFLLGGVWYAQVPLSALGVAVPTASDLALGVALGLVLFALNRGAASAGREFGLGGDEALREALAPDSAAGWLLLLLVALPVVAGFEELLFRGALVGGLAAGFGASPWLLAVGSSAAFGLGHGAQGRVGVVVTGLLGFVFAAAFVLTESLAVVVVAHYLVNALEFVVHEGLGWAPFDD